MAGRGPHVCGPWQRQSVDTVVDVQLILSSCHLARHTASAHSELLVRDHREPVNGRMDSAVCPSPMRRLPPVTYDSGKLSDQHKAKLGMLFLRTSIEEGGECRGNGLDTRARHLHKPRLHERAEFGLSHTIVGADHDCIRDIRVRGPVEAVQDSSLWVTAA